MNRKTSSDGYQWSWGPGEPDEPEPVPLEDRETSPLAAVPPRPPFPSDHSGLSGPFGPSASSDLADPSDISFHDEPPLHRPVRSRRARQRQRLARIVAPLLALVLIAAFVVVLRLPSVASQPVITQPPTPNTSIQAYILGSVNQP